MNVEYMTQLKKWAAQGLRWAEALLFKAQHSSPLPPGARMAINTNGEMVGAISMGCVENDLRENLLRVLEIGEPCVRHYGTAGNVVIEVGLTCGGEIDVLLRRQDMDDVWQALASRDEAQSVLLLTGVSGPCLGKQRAIFANGNSVGSLSSPACDAAVEKAAAPLRKRGGYTCLKANGLEVFAELWEAAPQLAIIGASPMATALCRMASLCGFDVAIVDPRKVYARAELFPGAKRVVHEWPEEGLRQLGVNSSWFVAVLAHDEKLDVPALATALKTNCRYIGLLGSRKTQEKRRAALRELGFSAEMLERIRGPIGLECGALEPAEIAVSILAELIAVRRAMPC